MSYNSLILIPASNVALPIVTPAIPVGSPMVVQPASNVASPIVSPAIPFGSPMVVQLQVEAAAPSSSLYLSRTSSHGCLHRPSSSQSFSQPSSALYPLAPHPSSSLCLPHPPSIAVPAVIHASPLSEACIPVAPSQKVVSAHMVGNSIGFPSRCPLCSSNSSNNRAKVGFKRLIQRILKGQY